MLDLLGKAFLFENARQDGEYLRIDYRPDPGYSTQSMEERRCSVMRISPLVEQQRRCGGAIEGKIPEDVSIGFGLLATVKAGSKFGTTRQPVSASEWKTETMDTEIVGRAILFKAIGKNEHAVHSDFKLLPSSLSVADAVGMLVK